jgi:hypothetical protein
MKCPNCESERIISARHDSDWGGGNSLNAVNNEKCYNEGDLDEEGDVYAFGDINIYACLACDYTWQRHGKEVMSALRARLAECEAVMEQAIYAIRSGGERHLFSDESEAIELYEAYKSSHEVKK